MAETSRHLAPWDDPSVEIWGLNESYARRHKAKGETYMRRWDRWFQMHPYWDFTRAANFNHPNHPHWILNRKGPCFECQGRGKIQRPGQPDLQCPECDGSGTYDPDRDRRTSFDYPFPIYCLEAYSEVPGSVAYPLADIIASYPKNEKEVRWFTNSFGLMVALAIRLGAKRIEAYGFEMSSKTEFGEQKPNAAFWSAIAIGRGVDLYLPDDCSLLGYKDQLYGYEKVPGMTAMHAEIQLNALHQAVSKAQAELNQMRGVKARLLAQMKAAQGLSVAGRQKQQAEFQELLNKEVQKVMELNALFGAEQQAKRVHDEVKMLATVSRVHFLDLEGKRHGVDTAQFEAEAKAALDPRVKIAEPDEGMVPEINLYG
jgi:hypothetical protein